MTTNPAALQPTYDGYIRTTTDALFLFEACLTGRLSHVPRRPHDRERNQLIRSGCVFIYEENASGIKRWTDGVTWSPSRILGNFLVYRELDKPFPPGEKKRAMKKQNRRQPYSTNRNDHSGGTYSPTNVSSQGLGSERPSSDPERELVGSLVGSYDFKEISEGLVKKTMSVTVQGVTHHLVSYYKCDDVQDGKLKRPTEDARLVDIKPRNELQAKQNFRVPTADESNPDEQYLEGHTRDGYSNHYPYQQAMMGPPYMSHNNPRFFVSGNSFPALSHSTSTGSSQYSVPAPVGSQTYLSSADAMNTYGAGSFNRNFEGMGGHSVSTSMNSPVLPLSASQSDRSQNGSAVLYPQQNIHSRSMMNQSPLQVGSQSSNGYGMATPGQRGQVETRSSLQPSPTQMTTPSREPSIGSGLFAPDRGPSFYQNGTSSSISNHHQQHHQFAPSTQMPSWSAPSMVPPSQHLH